MVSVYLGGNQEYSARTLGATWGIISAIMVPIVIVFICIGWRILKKRKQDESEDDNEFMTIKSRPLDPDESVKINSDDESIPYKKDLPEDSPEPTEPVQVADNSTTYPYGQYDQPQSSTPLNQQTRQWDGQALPGQSDQQWDGLPPPPPQPEDQQWADGQSQPLNQNDARQWQEETEIN